MASADSAGPKEVFLHDPLRASAGAKAVVIESSWFSQFKRVEHLNMFL